MRNQGSIFAKHTTPLTPAIIVITLTKVINTIPTWASSPWTTPKALSTTFWPVNGWLYVFVFAPLFVYVCVFVFTFSFVYIFAFVFVLPTTFWPGNGCVALSMLLLIRAPLSYESKGKCVKRYINNPMICILCFHITEFSIHKYVFSCILSKHLSVVQQPHRQCHMPPWPCSDWSQRTR